MPSTLAHIAIVICSLQTETTETFSVQPAKTTDASPNKTICY